MLMWYDKLAFAGLAVAFVSAMMFIVGLWNMMSARDQARASLRASIRQAQEELHPRLNDRVHLHDTDQ